MGTALTNKITSDVLAKEGSVMPLSGDHLFAKLLLHRKVSQRDFEFVILLTFPKLITLNSECCASGLTKTKAGAVWLPACARAFLRSATLVPRYCDSELFIVTIRYNYHVGLHLFPVVHG